MNSEYNDESNDSQEPKIEIPQQISEFCLGECDVQVLGRNEESGRPLVYCMGCGRNMGC
jgi:hypothetical protein